MASIVDFIRTLLRLDGGRPAQRGKSYPECEPLEQSRPLYIGRGMVCLGGALRSPPQRRGART
jgi:hypothetical protein